MNDVPNLVDRVRKVDISKLTPEEADQIGEQLGEKLREIADRACDEANKISKIYGLEVVMQFCLRPENHKTDVKQSSGASGE